MSGSPASHEALSVDVVPHRDEVAVLRSGELDLASVDAVAREIEELRRSGLSHVVIDLRDATFIDSTGLRLLLGLRNDAERDGPGSSWCPVPPRPSGSSS